MKNFFSVVFCVLSISAFTQNTRITGNIIADAEAIPFGEITVFSATDSTLKKGSYVDSSYFSIVMNTGNESRFYARISLPNYIDTLIDFEVTGEVVDLGQITMAKNLDLDAVNVTYRKDMFSRTMDGVSVNVAGTNLETLLNLFQVLKASPKIMSPDDQSIQIIGRGVPLIMVDRQAIISFDELKAIPATQVDRIEIITNPSARYKAQGSGNGVIEVYTKNFHYQGYNVTLRADAGINTKLLPMGRGQAGINLKKNKFSLNVYLGGSYNSYIGSNFFNISTTDASGRKLDAETDFQSYDFWQNYTVKAAYDVSRKQRVSFGVNGFGGGGSSENNSSAEFSIVGVDQLINNATSTSTWRSFDNTAFVNYVIETSEHRSNLEINLNYLNKVSNNFGHSNSVFEDPILNQIDNFDVRNDSRDVPHVGELRIIYDHRFDTTGWRLTTGGSFSLLFNEKRLERYNEIDSEWIIDTDFTNSYDYQEDNGGLFVEVSKRWEKVGFRAGLRTEYTGLQGFSNTLDKEFIDSTYIVPFPSASIMYQPSEKVAITAFYSTGIDRPQFSNYDPFVRVVDSLIIEYGNPLLRPAIQQSFGLDVDLFYAYNVAITYTQKKAPISSISFIDDDTFLMETTPWNADQDQELNASFSIPLKTKWMQGWNSLWISYSKYSFTPIYERDPFFNVTFGVYSFLAFDLPRDFNLINRLNIRKGGSFESTSNTTVNWGLKLNKRYKGGNFQIYGEVANIIPPVRKSSSVSGNFVVYTEGQSQFTSFKVGFFYKFGRLRVDAKIKESSSDQKDRL
jgi:hypothetical protein